MLNKQWREAKKKNPEKFKILLGLEPRTIVQSYHRMEKRYSEGHFWDD